MASSYIRSVRSRFCLHAFADVSLHEAFGHDAEMIENITNQIDARAPIVIEATGINAGMAPGRMAKSGVTALNLLVTAESRRVSN